MLNRVRLNLPDLVIDQSAAAGPRLVNVAIVGFSPGILFTVRNQGMAAALRITLATVYIRGRFDDYATGIQTPPLNVGQSVQLVVAVPDWVAQAFSCHGMAIWADAGAAIVEGNEGNNVFLRQRQLNCYFYAGS